MIASTAFLYGRSLALNLLAGGFRNDLDALGDRTPHDDRYRRTVEFGKIVRHLVEVPETPLTFEGRYYEVRNLRLTPSIAEGQRPAFLISGSSPAGMEAAREIGATAIRYPEPSEVEETAEHPTDLARGIRVGIIARADAAEAWRVARERFPEERKGQIQHGLAMKVSDSHWHRQLSERPAGGDDESDPYWLHPFQNYQTFCPYLVGSYERVASELARYIDAGYHTIVLDIPPDREELTHTGVVLDRARSVGLA
jgi:alkanesulfonate monooxygenase